MLGNTANVMSRLSLKRQKARSALLLEKGA
jgi:hypothetical protein